MHMALALLCVKDERETTLITATIDKNESKQTATYMVLRVHSKSPVGQKTETQRYWPGLHTGSMLPSPVTPFHDSHNKDDHGKPVYATLHTVQYKQCKECNQD